MSSPQPPRPAKLVVGFFTKDKNIIKPLVTDLSENFGSIDIVSTWFPFDYTKYYEREMGAPLYRRVLSFRSLIEQNSLAEIKRITNDIEMKHSLEDRRLVNIDPGYMVHERFVLATGKNYTHRIYLEKGIYADLTLIYQKGGFQSLPWTYPDYA
ncbi:DUF4416 family protein, partial [Thermodesulfobacteriota bacterium]